MKGGRMFNLKTERKRFLDLNVQDILARHWRPNSAAETENLSPHKMSSQSFRFPKSQSFRFLNKNCPSIEEGYTKKQFHDFRLASLKKEVDELQAIFKCEQAKRRILEKALQKAPSIPSLKDLTPETMEDLVEEIAMLELEVTNLEQHLLNLYRQVFTQCSESSDYNCKWMKSSESTKAGELQNQPFIENWQGIPQRSPLCDREQSQHHNSAQNSLEKSWTLEYSHPPPISFPQGTLYRDTFVKHYTNNGQRPVAEKTSANAANRLSKDLVRCMAALYCRLAQPPVPQQEPENSPLSSSSASTFPARRLYNEGWPSHRRIDASYDGSCSDLHKRNYTTKATSAFEVQWICVDDDRLADAATMLHNVQSFVQKLEYVDPGKMSHEQKLAFWINVHNALVMHAYLAYGIPRNHLKKTSLLQKAAYRIGAHTISAKTIEENILKCRPYRPSKWLHSILSPAAAAAAAAGGGGGGGKLRGEEREEYAIQTPEPLLCFALCSGSRSDPPVRVYTHKLIYLQLEGAQHEFLHAHVNAHRDGKLYLSSILQSFAKDASMNSSQLLEWISTNMEGEMASLIARCTLNAKGKAHKCIQWIQYDFTFGYIFAYPF